MQKCVALCYFQVPLSYWLFNKYDGTFSEDYRTYDSLIGEQIVNTSHAVTSRPSRQLNYIVLSLHIVFKLCL